MPIAAHPPPRPPGLRSEVYRPQPGLPEVWRIGWSRFAHARQQGLAEHTHPGLWEICYIVHGQVDWWVEDQVYQVKRGQVYLTRPGERHGGVDAIMNRCELYWLLVSLPHSCRLPATPPAQARALVRGYERTKLHHFPGSPDLPARYERLMAEYRSPSPLSTLAARAALHQLLVHVLRDEQSHARRLSDRLAARSPAIDAALAHIESNFDQEIPIARLAGLAGLSQSHFRARFLRQTGQTPGECLAQRRLLEAKRLLRASPLSITQIAHRLSFSTSQYFATVFKKLAGLTPLEYRGRYAGQNR